MFSPSRADLPAQQANHQNASSQNVSSSPTPSPTLIKPLTKLLNVEVVVLDVPADYAHLWQRYRRGIQYVYDHFRQDFDWFCKADDDTYVVVENLREYLKRLEILMQWLQQPMQLGHRVNTDQAVINIYVNKLDAVHQQEYHQRFDRWVFNSGGSGYPTNGLYLDQLMVSLPKATCFSDVDSQTVPEDTSTTFCMMWNNVFPEDTRDVHGRERWTRDPDFWFVKYHQGVGGVRAGDDCCAPDSIAYHNGTPIT